MVNKNSIKKFLIATGLAAIVLAASGCSGTIEKTAEEISYRTLTGKVGEATLYSGGKVVKHYDLVFIPYSSADSRTLWMELPDGERCIGKEMR